jgi:serine-type D-Ala-D-Ala carboxypeptidase (penicillin-binding protein 5/6)
MNHVILLAKYFTTSLVVFICLYVISLGIALPVLSPTTEVSILGASQSETEELRNFVSYQIPANQNDTKLQAAGYEILDISDGSILIKDHTDIPLPIASLTKLMTAWVTLKYGSLNDAYIVQASDIESISPSLNLKVGDEVKVKDLLNAMLIGSNNDSAKALAGYVSKKTNQKFVDLMNQEAKTLGMKSSRYNNPIGFDSNTNYSSVDDIALLVEALLPTGVFDQTSKEANYSFESLSGKVFTTSATNKLIDKYPDLYAIKTGFTNTALGSMVNLLKHNDRTYLLIVIGSPDRETDTLELRNLVISH